MVIYPATTSFPGRPGGQSGAEVQDRGGLRKCGASGKMARRSSISRNTMHNRHREEGETGLCDRPRQPKRSPHRTTLKGALSLRRIAHALGLSGDGPLHPAPPFRGGTPPTRDVEFGMVTFSTSRSRTGPFGTRIRRVSRRKRCQGRMGRSPSTTSGLSAREPVERKLLTKGAGALQFAEGDAGDRRWDR